MEVDGVDCADNLESSINFMYMKMESICSSQLWGKWALSQFCIHGCKSLFWDMILVAGSQVVLFWVAIWVTCSYWNKKFEYIILGEKLSCDN